MLASLNRRAFFRTCGASASALTLSALTPGLARAENKAKITLIGFDDDDEVLIRKAARMAVSRVQSKAIWGKIRAKGVKHSLSDDALKLVKDRKRSVEVTAEELMLHQLWFLAAPNGDHDKLPAFPDITIKGEAWKKEAGKPDVLGRAPLDEVIIYVHHWDKNKDTGEDEPDWRYEGNFNLKLNTRIINSGGRYDTAEEWASTIAHEMAHNLGHRHPEGKGPWQIEALNDAVYSNGK